MMSSRPVRGWSSSTSYWQRIAILSLTGCVFAVAVSSVAVAGTADDDYRNAIGLYKKGRWKLSAAALKLYLKQHPGTPKIPYVRLYLGVSLENLERYREARRVLRAFIKDYPQNANRKDALYRVGECSYFLGEWKTAETELLAFLQAAPKHEYREYALPNLAESQFRQQKLAAAVENYRKSLRQFRNGRMVADSKLGLARCYQTLKKTDEAIQLYRDVAVMKESHAAPDAQMELGQFYYELRRFNDSAKAYDRFEQLFAKYPRIPRARLNAGFAYYQSGDFRTALSRFEKAAQNSALRQQSHYWIGFCYKALKEYPQAVALLKAEFARDGKTGVAAEILYQWATCERLANRPEQARLLYLDFVKRWPKKTNADQSLHYAGEMALAAGKLQDATALIERFKTEYPRSLLWPYQLILQGRVLESQRGQANLRKAAELFGAVLRKSRNPRTQSLARFYLARTQRRLDDHKSALQTLEPLLKLVRKQGKSSEFHDAWILAGRSFLALKRDKEAISAMTEYLTVEPKGESTRLALAVRIEAASRLKQKKQVRNDLDRLAKTPTGIELYAQTLHDVAEAAYTRKDWKWSEELFRRLVDDGRVKRFQAAALSGLGWSQFDQKEYEKSAATFARIVKEFPQNPVLAPQAGYQQGESLVQAGQLKEAAVAFSATFQKFTPEKPAAAGSEREGKPYYYTYHAGLAAARTYAKLKQTKNADTAYEKLFSRFPQADGLDVRLDEWALLNYNAGKFKRSDEIFRRLILDVPDSDLVDNARYSLAESNLNAGKTAEAEKTFASLYAGKKSDSVVRELSLYRLIGIGVERNRWQDVRKFAGLFRRQYTRSEQRWYASFYHAEASLRLNDPVTAHRQLQLLQRQKEDSVAGKSAWFPRIWILLAEIALRNRQYKDVEKIVADLRKRRPKSPLLFQADEVLGRGFKKQALFEKARQAFTRVVNHPAGKGSETAAKCQFLIAECWLMQDETKKARQAYLRVDNLYAYPEWQAPALFMTGRCEEALKEWTAAVKTYRDLMQRFPKSPYTAKAKPRLQLVLKKVPRK